MEDFSSNERFQQQHARPISGEDLEVMGKRAAASWADGSHETLSAAVVETVKHAGLSPEQVLRVVEFTNTDAFLREFRKEGSSKYVDFGSGGPADPRAIMQDLNDGGGGSVFDPGTGDYRQPPPEKLAALSVDDSPLYAAFGERHGDVAYPDHNPMGEVIELRDKLATAYDSYSSMLLSMDNMADDLRGQLFHHVKQASLSGHSLGEIVNIWEQHAPDGEYVKIAFDLLLDQLVANGVFPTTEHLVASLEKSASTTMRPNPEHPLVKDFVDFCEVIEKMAQVRADRAEAHKGLTDISSFMKQGGLIPAAWGALDSVADAAGAGGEHIGRLIGNEAVGKHVRGAVKGTIKYVAPAVGVHEVYRRHAKHNPKVQHATEKALSVVPFTDAYDRRDQELAARAYAKHNGGM